MKEKIITSLALLVLLATVIGGIGRVEASTIYPQSEPIVSEIVTISVDCQTADVLVGSVVTSEDPALMHFPSGIDMNTDEWENVIEVNVKFSRDICYLVFSFENVDENTARTIANDLKLDFESVFGVTYTYSSTTPNSEVIVTYIKLGEVNLPQRTQELIDSCLAQDLDGFSLTFVPMSWEPTAITALSATKWSGGFDWEYSMIVTYSTSIPPGTGTHTIDVLELLHVESLEPSPYSDLSTASGTVQIYGEVDFVDCEPEQTQEPEQRGWYIQDFGSALIGIFSFGDDPTPSTELWLQFSGVVVPEFTALTLTTALAFATLTVVIVERLFKRK